MIYPGKSTATETEKSMAARIRQEKLPRQCLEVEKNLNSMINLREWDDIGRGRIAVMGTYIYVCMKEMNPDRNAHLR